MLKKKPAIRDYNDIYRENFEDSEEKRIKQNNGNELKYKIKIKINIS